MEFSLKWTILNIYFSKIFNIEINYSHIIKHYITPRCTDYSLLHTIIVYNSTQNTFPFTYFSLRK